MTHTQRFRRTGISSTARALSLAVSFGLAVVAPTQTRAAETVVVPGPSPLGNYLAGRHAQTERDLGAAVTYLNAALHALPDAPDLLRRTFILTTIEGRMNEALPLAERLLQDNPKAPIAHLALLADAFRRGDSDDQAARLKALPNDGLNGFAKPAIAAWNLVGAGKVDAGLKTLESLDNKAASQGLYEMQRALILDFGGRNADAEAAYADLAKDQDAQSFRYTQLLGNMLERIGKTAEARALYDGFMAQNPTTSLLDTAYARLKSGKKPKRQIATAAQGAAEALFNIANSLRQQRARETAMVLGRLALWVRSDYPIAQMMVADILEGDERHAQANQAYAAIDPKSAFRFSADLRRAHNLNALKQVEPAVALLRELSAGHPKSAQPLLSLGDLFRRHERWTEAIDAYTEAIARVGTLQKSHWRMLYSRGIVLERAQRWPEAEKDFLKALEFEPDQPYVLNYLGYSWVDRGVQLKRALEMIHNAVKKRPNDGYIVDSLGWIYYRLGDYAKAVMELERAVQIRPEDPVINDHLGDAYWRVGRKLEARFQWERSLSLNPEKDVEAGVRKKLEEGLPPAKPLGVPNEADKAANPDKT
ncbi:MAG: tetratricopeptide repeat protein [Rhodospirillaceae bacterium]